jgi:hypothetical protein
VFVLAVIWRFLDSRRAILPACIGLLALAASVATCGSAAAAAVPAVDPATGAMEELATQLFTPSFCDGGPRRTVGIWAFDQDHIPVSAGVADRIYTSALNTLIARKPACVDVLDGSAIRDIAEHLKRTGAFREAGENPLLALERANRSVAILAQGDIFTQDGAVYVSFRAVARESAVVLAQSKPWRLPEAFVRSAAEDAALTLDVALQRAANQLVARAGRLNVLIPLGVYYQDTGAQPPLARYLLDGLLGAIESEKANLLTGPTLRVIQPDLRLGPKTGAMTTIDDFDPLSAGGKPAEGVFELTGRYWQVGDAIDLKLVLRSRTAETVSWQGRVRLDGLPDLSAKPKGGGIGAGEVGESAFLLQMTSPRGAAPFYRPGEELTVFLRSDKAAWLTCFYIDTAGAVMKVLPNGFQGDQAAESRIEPGVLRALPDARRDPFKFQFTATTLGEEVLKCFATTGDPAPHLPKPLLAPGFVPLSADLARRLDAVFHSLPDMLVAEAALTVTVGTDVRPPEPATGGS